MAFPLPIQFLRTLLYSIISINYYILWRKKSKVLYKHTIMLKNTGVFSLFCSKKAILPTQSSIM